jgi:hypothetical protein
VQSFCEVAVLLLIVAAFLVVGSVRIRRLNSALTALHTAGPAIAAGMMLRRSTVGAAMALGRQMRKKVVVTTGFVFVAFVLRSVVSTMMAVAQRFQNQTAICPDPGVLRFCDSKCLNVYTSMNQWNTFTPEFHPTVVLISSPLALLVALWGMTDKRTMQLMKSSQREMLTQRKPQ